MWNEPTKKQLEKLPVLYSQDNIKTRNQKIMMHFFIGNCDWWVTEYSPEDRIFFGFCNLGDPQMSEWGNVSLDELIDFKMGSMQIERDMHWKVRPASKVKEIVRMCDWMMNN